MQGTKVLLAAALSLALGGSALAQDRDRDRDHDRDRDRARWEQQRDRRERERERERWERSHRGQAYPNGGYYPNGTYYPNGRSPNGQYPGTYGAYGNQQGYQLQQMGYQDGLSDGSRDRATGHSYRPTEDLNYRLRNRGNYGNAYNQAYMQGYQRGYQSQGGSSRWPY